MGGRPPLPRVIDVIRSRVEENADSILAAYFDALGDPDPRIRMRASEALLDRAYGRPKRTEEAQPITDEINLSTLSDDELELYSNLIEKAYGPQPAD